MVKLRHDRLVWALTSKDAGVLKNDDLASFCGVKLRRFLQLKSEYRKTGSVPRLNNARRPQKVLTSAEKRVIDKAYKKAHLGATLLRLYILKEFDMRISHNKIHSYLLEKGLAREAPNKKVSRIPGKRNSGAGKRAHTKRDGYYTGVFGSMDICQCRHSPGKKVLVFIDGVSRKVIRAIEAKDVGERQIHDMIEYANGFYWENYHTPIRNIFISRSLLDTCVPEESMDRLRKSFAGNRITDVDSADDHIGGHSRIKRWFRIYGNHRRRFKTVGQFVDWYNCRVHGALGRQVGVSPDEAAYSRLSQDSMLGLFFRGMEEGKFQDV